MLEARRDQYDLYVRRTRSPLWGRYQQALERLLTGIDRFFAFHDRTGRRSCFVKPWTRCLQLALVYPIAFFLLAYLAGAGGDLASMEVLDADATFGRRLLAVVLLSTAALLMWSEVRWAWLQRATLCGVEKALRRRPGAVVRSITAAVAFAVAVAFAFAFAGVVAFAFAFAGVVAFAVAGAGAGAVAGAVAVAVILGFYVLFPLVNSLLDWLSLWVTRRLMRRWVGAKGTALGRFLAYVRGVSIDLLVAGGCICLLSALLAVEVAGLNLLLSWFAPAGEAPMRLDWARLMRAFRHDPFGEGLFITLMFYSTLLPTVVHLTAGTVACVTMPNLGRDYVMRTLAKDKLAPTELLGAGCVTASVRMIPLVVYAVLMALVWRFFLSTDHLRWVMDGLAVIPDKWIAAVPADEPFLIWLPYAISDWVWTVLGGGV